VAQHSPTFGGSTIRMAPRFDIKKTKFGVITCTGRGVFRGSATTLRYCTHVSHGLSTIAECEVYSGLVGVHIELYQELSARLVFRTNLVTRMNLINTRPNA